MKRLSRSLAFLALLFVAFFATTNTRSSAANNGFVPDPACVSFCQLQLESCFANGGKNNSHACFSIYRHCIAQCGKHD